jgi:hypothetical protein
MRGEAKVPGVLGKFVSFDLIDLANGVEFLSSVELNGTVKLRT